MESPRGAVLCRAAVREAHCLALAAYTLLLGREGSFYGITMLYRKDPRAFREDLPKLFELLVKKAIAPRIAERLPLLDARKANERLEQGNIEGKLVLVAVAETDARDRATESVRRAYTPDHPRSGAATQ